MNTLRTSCAALALLLLGAPHPRAAITIPGANNGTDGALNVTADLVIDLSKATTGVWDADNSANNVAGEPAVGVYDPDKWAVVFKYSSVTVAAGKTVTFKNHASRAPVVWLVSGDATINGTVSLNGANGGLGVTLAEPGPGGFRGGQAYYIPGVGATAGFGVGGGPGAVSDSGYGASYGTTGGNGPAPYGNPSLIPLIGGSGGGGGNRNEVVSGGAGGGAILIACANSLTLGGAIQANGGQGRWPNYTGGGGSGGGIRLVADTLVGAGVVNALGANNSSHSGGLGRIRIERVNNSRPDTAATVPAPSVVPLAPSDTALLWPPSGAPEVKIVSIGGQNIGPDPRAGFGTIGADAVLPQTSSAQVIIETTNVEMAAVLTVRGTPRSNGNYVNGTIQGAPVQISTDPEPLKLRWTATLPVSTGYSAVQVKVVRP